MTSFDEIAVTARDLEDLRIVLSAVLNYFQARDLMDAQVAFQSTHYSPLTNEVGRISQRFEGYWGDFLRARYDADTDEEALDEGDTPTEGLPGAEEPSESPSEASEELSLTPIAAPKISQKGRRVPARRKIVEEQGQEQDHEGDA